MSDYQRFVSYMYEYIDDKKTENRGFVKVELRNGTCQMQFRLNVFSLPPETPLQVYGFIQMDDVLQGFLLGTLHSGMNGNYGSNRSNHSGNNVGSGSDTGIQGQLSFPSRIPDTTYTVKDFNGLILTTSGKCYGTQWDETPIVPSRFRDEKPTSPEVIESFSEYVNQQSDNTDMQPAETEIQATQSQVKDSTPTSAGNSQAIKSSESKSELSNPKLSSSVRTSQQDVQIAATEAMRKRPQTSNTDPWRWAREQYAAIQPFDDEEICDCLRISMHDLTELRSHGFRLGCNQFIRHGYQNYHHLLLGRTRCGSKNVCVLGVPGVYNANEQFMASMFGFTWFKPAHFSKESTTSGKTGYWYRPLT